MKLSQKQFEQLFIKNKLILSLIGMSNIGKTHWSKQLCGINFKHINCDDLIAGKLVPELGASGYSNIRDVSRWMGQPYNKKFSANQRKYLELEKEIMKGIFAEIRNNHGQNTVIDTTGSFVHTDNDICAKLRKCALVVYIKTTDNMKGQMFKRYIRKPKPVVFGDIFQPKHGETSKQTLKRCYSKLLDLRDALYARYADVIIPREAIKKDMSAGQFISLIKQSL